VTHRSIGRLVLNCGYADFNADDRVALAANPAFDASTMEVWAPLLNGGCMVVIDREAFLEPKTFARLLEEQRVTGLFLTTAIFNQYASVIPEALSRLRLLMSGGEQSEPSSFVRVLTQSGPVRLIHCYGPTETTTFAITRDVTEVPEGLRSIPLGRPISNTRIYILDANRQPVPIGVAGELYIGGAGVARGYLNHPELTAERLLPDPFGQEPGARIYRTGDLGRRLRNGEIEFEGRNDFQVKIRGFRIEPGEIEAALTGYPGVREVLALAREDGDGGKRLVVYYTGEEIGGEALREHLSPRLPDYMIPSAYVYLETLPLTPNGKVDRKALPAPEGRPKSLQYVAPRNSMEEMLAGIWAEVLRVDRVGIEDDFFNLGGDSILALRVQAKAQQRGAEFTLEDLFTMRQIRRLSESMGGRGEVARRERTAAFSLLSEADRARVIEAGYEDAYPLSRLQAGMIFHNLWERGSSTYHDVIGLRVEGALHEAVLKEVLAAVVRRHSILRTTLHPGDYEEALQCVHREMGACVEVADWEGLGQTEREQELKRFVEEEARRAFDLARGPLARFFIHRLGTEEFQLTLSVHHAVIDGWSVAALMTEIFERYLDRLEGKEDGSSRPLQSDYREFIAEEQRALRSSEHREYWERVVGEMERSPLWRVEGPEAGEAAARGAEAEASADLQVLLPEEIAQGVTVFAQRAGVPVKSVFLAAHLNALRALMGGRDVITGLVANARLEEEDGEKVIGLFLNTVPVRFRAREADSWEDLARRALELEQEMLAHRRYPVVEIYRRHGGKDLLEVIFNFVNFHVVKALTGRLKGRVVQGAYQTNFSLVINVEFTSQPSSAGALSISYQLGKLTRSQVERFSEIYLMSLREMIARPRQSYLARPLLPTWDQLRLNEWNRTEAEYPSGPGIHELFEAQVERRPDAIALEHGDRRLTYRELNARANRVAHHLLRLGVGPETRVAILLERSIDLVVAQLATLKCGAAYVPIDPTFPRERQVFIVIDCAAHLVIAANSDMLPGDLAPPQVEIDDLGRLEVEAGNLNLPSDSEMTAYVMYTSGSTGRPKGVMVRHRGIARLVLNCGYADFNASDRMAFASNPAFDASTMEVWAPVLNGGRIVVIDQNCLLEPGLFAQALMRHEINMLFLT
ncbi:MAG TPA: AMP-binding protein, partial [Blastocatellia bacterium]|nr:AMP-binding protein [Blastocatellia bacterium]